VLAFVVDWANGDRWVRLRTKGKKRCYLDALATTTFLPGEGAKLAAQMRVHTAPSTEGLNEQRRSSRIPDVDDLTRDVRNDPR